MEIEDGIDSNGKKLTQKEINEIDEKITREASEITDKYLEKLLRDALINVTVTFTDGTQETQTLNVDYILTDDDGNIIFDQKTDDFANLKYDALNVHTNIVFRYAE